VSTAGELIEDLHAVVIDLDMSVRVSVVGNDEDLHIIDIVVNPSDGVVRLIAETGEDVEDVEVAGPSPS